jgi:hypothetical protein
MPIRGSAGTCKTRDSSLVAPCAPPHTEHNDQLTSGTYETARLTTAHAQRFKH